MEYKRPILVTVICILSFIGAPLTLYGLLFDPTLLAAPLGAVIPLWYSVFSAVWIIPYLAALVFIWKMKKIGLTAYTGLAVIDYIVMFTAGLATITVLIISVVAIGLLWTQYKKMS